MIDMKTTQEPNATEGRRYHVWVENTRTRRRVCLTGYPDTHDNACRITSKQTKRPDARYFLEEAERPAPEEIDEEIPQQDRPRG